MLLMCDLFVTFKCVTASVFFQSLAISFSEAHPVMIFTSIRFSLNLWPSLYSAQGELMVQQWAPLQGYSASAPYRQVGEEANNNVLIFGNQGKFQCKQNCLFKGLLLMFAVSSALWPLQLELGSLWASLPYNYNFANTFNFVKSVSSS